jgi:predicted N-acetyltransferase YhbS
MMAVKIAPATPEHVPEMGRICYEAFKDISSRHNFPPDFDNVALARMIEGLLVQREDCYSVVIQADGQTAGSNHLLMADEVAAVGPVTVDVNLQGNGIGRSLMEHVIDHAHRSGMESVRLMQDSYNLASLSLYGSLGFDVKDAVALMQPTAAPADESSVRPITEDDLSEIGELSTRIYRASRQNEVVALLQGPFPALLRERGGRVTGYFVLGVIGHGVAETEEDALVLVQQAARGAPPDVARVFCPLSQGSLYRGFLAAGFRAIKVMNLMAMGTYQPPEGVWMPSVGF